MKPSFHRLCLIAILLLCCGFMDVLAKREALSQHKDITILGLNLDSKPSEFIDKFGSDLVQGEIAGVTQYHWNKTYLSIDVHGDEVLRISGVQAEIDGEEFFVEEESFVTLSSLFGKPSRVLYAHNGEPCHSWANGFQAFSDPASDKPTGFALTKEPGIHGLDVIIR